jgi:hypothetical protein
MSPTLTRQSHLSGTANPARSEASGLVTGCPHNADVRSQRDTFDRLFGPHDDTAEVWANNDVPMLLTDEEARQCAEELYSVMRTWHEHGQRRRPLGEQAPRTYLVVSMILPHMAE